jgi:hypothetical protein
VEEAGVVMIVDEDAESINILEVLGLSAIPVADVIHRRVTAKYVTDSVVHGVVKQSSDVVLIGSNVSGIAVEALAHLENTSRCSVLTPEVLGNLGDCVDTDAIELVFCHDVLYPVLEVASDVRVTVLVEVWQVGKAAILDLGLIVPVDDLAVGVVMFRLIEGIDLAVVSTDRADVVSDNVDHHPDTLGVGCADEVNEVLLGTKVRVCALPIGGMVAMIAAGGILNDGGNPDGVESHTLDVRKLVDHALVVTATIVGEIGAGRGGAVSSGKSVG